MSLPPPDEPTPDGDGVLSGEYRSNFGRNLKAARNRIGMTQSELATRVGSTQGYISHVEVGTENLTFEAATRLALTVGRKLPDMLLPPDDLPK